MTTNSSWRGLPTLVASQWRRLRALGKRKSPAERDDANAKASARKYWQDKVAEGEGQPPEAARSEADKAAEASASQYWEREVADEKTRRGTPDPPPKG